MEQRLVRRRRDRDDRCLAGSCRDRRDCLRPRRSNIWIYYLAEGGNVNELGWQGNWFHNDLTAITQSPPAAPVSALQAFGRDGTNPRVYYQTWDGHLHELFWESHWGQADLTGMPTG